MAYSTETFGKAIFEKTNGTMNIFGEFKRITKPVDIICNRCGEIKHYIVSANAIKYDVFCTKCDLESRKLNYKNIYPINKLSQLEAKQKIRDASAGVLELVSEYTGIKDYHDFKCNKCGYISSREFNSIAYMGRRGCDNCGSNMVKSGMVYYVKFSHSKKIFYKFGSSRHGYEKRIVTNSIGNSAKVISAHTCDVGIYKNAIEIEKLVHSRFTGMSIKNKILRSGNTEVYDFDILGVFSEKNDSNFIEILGEFLGENELKKWVKIK